MEDAPMMELVLRLPDFILANVESILAEWEAFAGTVRVGAAMDALALRDHAEDILRATVRDMTAAQTGRERSDKSKGLGEASAHSDGLDEASHEHAIGRVASGFNLVEVVSEYRALRASVLRRWRASTPSRDERDVDDTTRFNESIDQSLIKAVVGFTHRVDESSQMFLAILGHDLRSPLFAVRISAEALQQLPQLDEQSRVAAEQIATSAKEMMRMILDLLDFTTTRLGRGMPIAPESMDVQRLCREVLAELQPVHADRPMHLHVDGDMTITCDPRRLRQALSNLIQNAVQHGRARTPIDVSLRCERGGVVVAVYNEGDPIPVQSLPTIFDPMVRPKAATSSIRRPGSIGLGLYIARQIATAHGGRIDVTSTADAGTTFTLRLPRRCTSHG
jgi:signal transduction histidine kinase